MSDRPLRGFAHFGRRLWSKVRRYPKEILLSGMLITTALGIVPLTHVAHELHELNQHAVAMTQSPPSQAQPERSPSIESFAVRFDDSCMEDDGREPEHPRTDCNQAIAGDLSGNDTAKIGGFLVWRTSVHHGDSVIHHIHFKHESQPEAPQPRP